jgi:hypothetical protein
MPDSNDLKSLDSQLKKTLISAESFKKGSSVDVSKSILNVQKTFGSLIGNVRQLVTSVVSLEKIVNNNSKKITILKNISKTQSTRISGENIGAKLPGSSASNVEDSITKISVSVASIAAILAGRKKALDDTAAFDRRKAEQEKRGLAEANLEKRFDGLKSAAEKIIAPVKSILDRIIDFFVTVFLGRVVYKLLEWFGDKKNADKVKSIGRFLKDFGPAILTAFVLFGTSFGRLTLGLTKMIGGFIFKIGKVLIPQLLKLIARHPKAALAVGLLTAGATIPAMFPGTVDEQEKKTKSKPGSTEDKIKALEQQKTNLNPLQKMQGVGSEIDEQLSTLKTGQTKSYGFSGGGFNFKGMLGGGGLGAMLGPLGMLLGGALGSGKPQEMFGGFVSGEKGVDKVPAMLSDGEFVMSAGAVQKYGVDTLEGMNAAGGGTNKPKMISGTTYAAGGGMIGENPDPNYKNPGEERRLDLIKSLERYGSAAVTGGIEKGGDVLNAIKNLSSVLSGGGGGQSSGGGSGGFLGGLGYAGRVGGEVTKKVAPTLSRAGRVVGEVKKKVDPVIKGIPGFVGSTMSGINELSKNVTGASQEAIPALLNSVLGISKTDKNISTDMQRAILQAKATAKEKGRDFVEYEDYKGGGMSAGGLTMGRIGDKEFKRDDKGRIIGLRQVYDTNATAKGALDEGIQGIKTGFGDLFGGRGFNMKAFGRGIYKPAEALLAATQQRGMTMHDVNFDEKVLGFKPGKEVLNDTQRQMIAGQKNREKLQEKRPWWDKMGLFGGASKEIKEKQRQAQIPKSKPKNVRGGGVKPPINPKPRVVYGPPAPKKRNVRGGGSSTKTPKFSASGPGGNAKQKTLGVTR